MFALSVSTGVISLGRRKAGLKSTSGAKVVKRVILRRSPRRSVKKMPSAIVEHVKLTIVPGMPQTYGRINFTLEELELMIVKGPFKFPRDDKTQKYLSVENWFNYPDLVLYYGPSNIVHIIQFIEMVQAQKAQTPEKTICLVAKSDSDQSLNALLLCAAYLMLVDDMHPKEIMLKINPVVKEIKRRFYKTEGEELEDDLHITILDCLQGLKVFMSLNLIDLNNIDVEEATMREHPLNGDMNWIIPGKILGFAGPTEEVYTVEEFKDYALSKRINTVVRLNRNHYDAQVLIDAGITHRDMFIHDGNIPTLEQIDDFYLLAETAWNSGALAAHCRAGLGRTGTMIATFLIKKFNLQASDVIAYLRMMRPGSVLGMQARYLDSIQYILREETIPESAKKYLAQYYPQHFAASATLNDSEDVFVMLENGEEEEEEEKEEIPQIKTNGGIRAK